MKKSNNQTGSAHVVIIVILVLVIIGLLGFVFWQNFINKPAANQANTSQSTSAASTSKNDTKAPAATGFTVTQWSIKVPTTATDFIAAVPSDVQSANGISFLDVTTSALKAEATKANCDDWNIGTLYREPTSDNEPTPHSGKIGNYYYGFTPRSQAACVDASGNGAEPLNTLMMNAEADLKAAIVNTTAQ